jgi:hypothetical protein
MTVEVNPSPQDFTRDTCPNELLHTHAWWRLRARVGGGYLYYYLARDSANFPFRWAVGHTSTRVSQYIYDAVRSTETVAGYAGLDATSADFRAASGLLQAASQLMAVPE